MSEPSGPSGPARTRIKICGITNEAMALAAAEAGADAIGLVFVASSPRLVHPGPAQRIFSVLPPLMSAVGVFLDPSDPDLQNWRGSWVQLHGKEEEPQIARIALRRRIIKGIRFDPAQILRWNKCPHVSALLIDGSEGGMGQGFRHEELAALMPQLNTSVILAGGLTPENVGEAIRIVQPMGVDVSSGVESSRGVKDATMIRDFCQAVREADDSRAGKSSHAASAPPAPPAANRRRASEPSEPVVGRPAGFD